MFQTRVISDTANVYEKNPSKLGPAACPLVDSRYCQTDSHYQPYFMDAFFINCFFMYECDISVNLWAWFCRLQNNAIRCSNKEIDSGELSS